MECGYQAGGLFLTAYYVDSDGRYRHWEKAGFRELPAEPIVSNDPCLVLVHTKDLRREFDKDETRRRWCSVSDFVAKTRAALNQTTAILYISGGGNPWAYFDGTNPPPYHSDKLQHIYKLSIPDAQAFGQSLTRLREDYEAERGSPNWDLLYSIWRLDAADFLSAVLLLINPDARERLRMFLESSLSKGPFGNQAWERDRPKNVSADILEQLIVVRSLLQSAVGIEREYAVLKSGVLAALPILPRVPKSARDDKEKRSHVASQEALTEARDRLSHDLFKNEFGGLLVPGFSDERLTDRDVVFRCLKGDANCRAEALGPALDVWRQKVGPTLNQLIDDVTVRYGFVTSESWHQAVRSVREAVGRLDNYGADAILGDQDARNMARAFWADCDAVRDFLAAMHKSFSAFFVRWDAARIEEAEDA